MSEINTLVSIVDDGSAPPRGLVPVPVLVATPVPVPALVPIPAPGPAVRQTRPPDRYVGPPF